MKKLIIGWILISAIILTTIAVFIVKNRDKINGPDNFAECAKLSASTIQESYPRVCVTESGVRFTEVLEPTPSSSPPPTATSSAGCKTTGCSGTLCVDENAEDIATTCEYREDYACYELMECKIQLDGECGWTATDASDSCFAETVIEPTT